MGKPVWLTKSIIEAIHLSQIREHGGKYGLREANLLDSAIAKPKNHCAYSKEPDIIVLAASYGYGLARNHCFIDGNKRAAFMAMYTFLGLNGYEIETTEPEVVDLMLGVADGSVSESEIIIWLRKRVISLAP